MDKVERAALVKQRGFHKAAITRVETFYDNIVADSINVEQVMTRLTMLNEAWNKYLEVQMTLETYDDDDSSHSNDIVEVEEKYCRIKSGLQVLVNNMNKSETKLDSASTHPSLSKIQEIRLPIINLPTFDGNLNQWVHFRDIFKSLIIKNDLLSNIQRLHYLNSSVVGEAKNLIENVPMSENNFDVAWELVYKRYNNPRIIINNHIKNLLNLPCITRESASDLRILINHVTSNINAIEAFKEISVPLHELIISQLMLQNLDMTTKKAWELSVSGIEPLTLDKLLSFLEERCQALESLRSNESKPHLNVRKVDSKSLVKSHVSVQNSCLVCKEYHALFNCLKFKNLDIEKRQTIVKTNNLCFNCLRPNHFSSQCTSNGCHECGKRHHTLLHKDKPPSGNYNVHVNSQPRGTNQGSENEEGEGEIATDTYCSFRNSKSKEVLLATAVIHVRDKVGHLHECRVLLDSASQSNFVTESLVQRLRLPKHRNPIPIQGINDLHSKTNHCVSIDLQSRHSPFKRVISCSVLPKITGTVPNSQINCSSWNLPENLNLADPKFHCPGQIDLLIGAELYFELLIPSDQLVNYGYPTLINTHLGWILSGAMPATDACEGSSGNHALLVTTNNLQDQLCRFWEIEEFIDPVLTTIENECETHFCQNTKRDSTGRYIVRLPLSKEPTTLGDSLKVAKNRLLLLERRLMKNAKLRSDYLQFMEEYESLQHMKAVEPDTNADVCYYIPHHPVFKEDSSTTKMRVVFDASTKPPTGSALNDILHVGPTIQQDLYSIVLRFRTHQVAFTADIAKMYRQIKIDEADTDLQRILWRRSPEEPIREYKLLTVTYGTACAPFLAIRCLKQLAEDEGHNYPEAAEILKRDMYVDDCISGKDTIEEALEVQRQLINLLKGGGFPLRKWCSNRSEVLEAVSEDERETQLPLKFCDEPNIKTLGILWDPASDKFKISYNDSNQRRGCFTKRNVLSMISSIFDPIGFISPVVITCKILLQKLWEAKIQWDEELPSELLQVWTSIYDQLSAISEIKIDRLVLSKGRQADIQIHGFCDASERAFGACIYVRSVNKSGDVGVKLLCSKSKVAPLKKLSLPRLELCAAVLLSRLTFKVLHILNIDISNVQLWTDSKIVLAWISDSPSRWKTFVANRVATIQNKTKDAHWSHVRSQENPADLISRGVSPQTLKTATLWWNGPCWLYKANEFPVQTFDLNLEDVPEQQPKVVSCFTNVNVEFDILNKFSDLFKLQCVIAYCLRFINACRKGNKTTGALTCKELKGALIICIKQVQLMHFTNEINDLKDAKLISKKSEIGSLAPFLDDDGVIRVGGRLHNSMLPFSSKFPILLPSRHNLTDLIIMKEHLRLLHANQQLLISSLRQRYWIPRIRQVVKRVIYRCLTCFKFKAKPAHQQMGVLPSPRVQPSRPFLNSGVDYAGPIILKPGLPRNRSSIKAYIAIFVCLATKAVHMELVTSLSSEAFIAAFRRFVSRRGRCMNIYSDNGTSFIGANNSLKELGKFLQSRNEQENLKCFAGSEDFTWHCIPPSAPHFGGLWEASVKSMKYHLRRAAGNRVFNYEEMNTLLCQIEGCLNSRPLTPLSNDPDDLSFLTPGHFLTGENLSFLPDSDFSNVPVNKLSRWQLVQEKMQFLWKRWSTEYLHGLQQRSKWCEKHENVKPGKLVLIKEECPPLQWQTAFIEEVHPGSDGLVRVVTVRTPRGLMKRPIHKLCPFPE